MAVQLRQSFSTNVGNVVSTAITAARKAKAEQQSKMEADFQTAIADGNMSFEAQLAFRQDQLEKARASTFVDDEYLAHLEQSVGNIKRLNRFDKYRSKYKDSLASLASGKKNASRHLSMLRSMLSTTLDPELRQEILGDITEAEKDVKAHDDAVFSNQMKKAQYDGTTETLKDAISKAKDRLSLARLSGNEEEASALEVTLTVLGQQKNKADIEDAHDDLEVTSLTKGLSASEKAIALADKINEADDASPVMIDGKKYGSAKEYWSMTRDAYLSGNGKGLFSDFFSEMNDEIKGKVDTVIAIKGHATEAALDAIKQETDQIRSRPEFEPYAEKVDNLAFTNLSKGFNTFANAILEKAAYGGDYKTADASLKGYSARYGVNADAFRMALRGELEKDINRLASELGGTTTPEELLKEEGMEDIAPIEEFEVPRMTKPEPAEEAAEAPPAAKPPQAPGARKVAAGETLGKIAAEQGMSLSKLLELNPQYKANPNLVRVGAELNVRAPEPAKAAAPLPPVPTTTTKPEVPVPGPAIPEKAPADASEALRREAEAIAKGEKEAAKKATSTFNVKPY